MKKLIHYKSLRQPPRFVLWLDKIFDLGIHRMEAYAPNFDMLARHVSMYGSEPGYRAERTKENGGRGLDFYSLDPEHDGTVVAWSWLTDEKEWEEQ